MCELLIKAISNTNPDPVKDQRGCYKRGDIVDVQADGFTWGREEGLPRFYIVKIPGITVTQAKKYMAAHIGPTTQTRRIYKQQWDKWQLAGKYGEFTQLPTVINDVTEDYEEIVPPGRWAQMEDRSDYDPFFSKPKIEILPEINAVKLTGQIRRITLAGLIPTMLTRCLYRIRADDVPTAIKNQLRDTGTITVTWNQIKGYVRNKLTDLDEE